MAAMRNLDFNSKEGKVGGLVQLSYLDFTDAYISEEITRAQGLLQRVEKSVGVDGLKMNATKTKFMSLS